MLGLNEPEAELYEEREVKEKIEVDASSPPSMTTATPLGRNSTSPSSSQSSLSFYETALSSAVCKSELAEKRFAGEEIASFYFLCLVLINKTCSNFRANSKLN